MPHYIEDNDQSSIRATCAIISTLAFFCSFDIVPNNILRETNARRPCGERGNRSCGERGNRPCGERGNRPCGERGNRPCGGVRPPLRRDAKANVPIACLIFACVASGSLSSSVDPILYLSGFGFFCKHEWVDSHQHVVPSWLDCALRTRCSQKCCDCERVCHRGRKC